MLETKKMELLKKKNDNMAELSPYKDRLREFKKRVILEGQYSNPAVYKAVEKQIRHYGAIDQAIQFELSIINLDLKKLRRLFYHDTKEATNV